MAMRMGDLPVESGPGCRALIFRCIEELRDSFSGYFLRSLQNIVNMLQVDAADSREQIQTLLIKNVDVCVTIIAIQFMIMKCDYQQLCT